MPALGNKGNNLVLLGYVEATICSEGFAREMINHHFRILMGDGQNTNFGNDD